MFYCSIYFVLNTVYAFLFAFIYRSDSRIFLYEILQAKVAQMLNGSPNYQAYGSVKKKNLIFLMW